MPGVAKAHHGEEVGAGGGGLGARNSDPIRSDPGRWGAGEAEGKVLEHARQELRVCVCVCSRHRNRTFKSPLYKGSGLVCPQRPLAVPSGIGL